MLNKMRIWFGNESNDPVSRALSLVDQAQITYKTAEICKNQAGCLASSFKKAGEQLGEWQPHLQSQRRLSSNSSLPIQELLFVLNRGLQLLQSCKKKGWVVRTLLRAESRQEFIEIHYSLLESMKLVSLTLPNGFNLEDLILIPDTPLENAADLDLTHLCQLSCELQLMLQAILQGNNTADEEEISRELMIHYEDMKLIRHLGQGNFGIVLEMEWMNHSVAVKVLKGNSFKEEMSIASFKHPNIVSVLGYSFETEHERNCIVMEKMDKDLKLVIRKRVNKKRGKPPFELRVSVSIMLQIATGMRFLHSKGVIHRDLKTENILVEDLNKLDLEHNLVVKIGDFGNSRANVGTEAGDFSPNRGTPGFRAPEVYGSGRYSQKADVYSYAMVCYHILAGKQAFEGVGNAFQRDQLLRDGQRPILDDDSGEKLRCLLQNCWQQTPDDRPDFSGICETLHSIRSNVYSSLEA